MPLDGRYIHVSIMSEDRDSTAFRTFAIPELLEQILLALPKRRDGLPDFNFFILQRVSRDFRDVIWRSSPLLRRMYLRDLDKDQDETQYEVLKWLSERGALPLMIETAKLSSKSRLFKCCPTAVYLDKKARCETLGYRLEGVSYAAAQLHDRKAQSTKPLFGRPNGLWRMFPIDPYSELVLCWQIDLVDPQKRLCYEMRNSISIFGSFLVRKSLSVQSDIYSTW